MRQGPDQHAVRALCALPQSRPLVYLRASTPHASCNYDTRCYTLAKPRLIQFISLASFDQMAEGLLDDHDLRVIQQILMEKPDAGVVIGGTSGLRKLRISLAGRGKRGGARLIYLYVEIRSVIYFVAVFSKAEQDDLTIADYRVLGDLARSLKREA